MSDKYLSQKKYLSTKKQIRAWVSQEKYNRLKEKASKNNVSLYCLLNNWIDKYLNEKPSD